MTLKIELENGEAWEVRTSTSDYVAFDQTGKRQKPPWGAMGDNVALWEAFIGWHASKRTGKYAGPWEKFLDECVMCDGVADEPVDPTNLLAGADSSSTSP
jgi:hypothetical protein